MKRVTLLLSLAVAGCNQILGLDEPGAGLDGGVELDGATGPDGALVDGVAPSCVPIGHDEDGDSVDDVCDVCPAAIDADQLDADADGVGDACDPSPLKHHRRLGFYGFSPVDRDALLLATDSQDHPFLIDDDTLRQDDASASAAGPDYLAYLAVPPHDRLRLSTALRVTSEAAGSQNHKAIGLWARATGGMNDGYPLGLGFEMTATDGASDSVHAARFGFSITSLIEPITTTIGAPAAYAWTTGATYQMTVDLDATGTTLGSIKGTSGGAALTYNGGYGMAGLVGLRLRGLAAEFDYLDVIVEEDQP